MVGAWGSLEKIKRKEKGRKIERMEKGKYCKAVNTWPNTRRKKIKYVLLGEDHNIKKIFEKQLLSLSS